jgi:hypothetical protein
VFWLYVLLRFIFQKIFRNRSKRAKVIAIAVSLLCTAALPLHVVIFWLTADMNYDRAIVPYVVAGSCISALTFLYLLFRFAYKKLRSRQSKRLAWIIFSLCGPAAFIATAKSLWLLFEWAHGT